ncbi:MAG TPA: hypothetical protein VH061_01160 [Solirubrobacteraceae bacterium]|nr:hypothetical protein [Solirubrobacteraceae bacterium]
MLLKVCQPCQRRLNTVFESPASILLKEMMDGAVIDLTPRQQVLVGGWAAKTGMLLILARTDIAWMDRMLRHYLLHMLKEGTPPANSTVRIAYLSNDLKPPGTSFIPPGWVDVLPAAESIVSIISVPGLIAEVIVAPVAVTRSFADMTQDDDRFVLVWPPQVPNQRWPPPILLGPLDSEAIRDEWGHTDWHGNFPAVDAQRWTESNDPS